MQDQQQSAIKDQSVGAIDQDQESLLVELARLKSEVEQLTKSVHLAYEQGWIACSGWACRSDLVSDIDSPAFLRERDTRLADPTLAKN